MPRICSYCPRTDLTDADFYSSRNICKRCTITRNNARAKRLAATGVCVDCMAAAEPGSSRCAECKKNARARYHARKLQHSTTAMKRRQRLKREAFTAYGGARCVCCGEKHLEFLSIDHIDGNGNTHRKALAAEFGWKADSRGVCGSTFYLWLKKNKYPPGFRVLCMNCNCALSRFGYCPHELAARGDSSEVTSAVDSLS